MADVGTVSKERALLMLGGAIVLVVLIMVLTQGGDDGDPFSTDLDDLDDLDDLADLDDLDDLDDLADLDDATTGEGFAPLDCTAFLPGDAAAIALETDDPEGRIISTFLFSQGERCVYEDAEDDRNYVVIEPAELADFDDGTTRHGVAAEPVDGLGAVAVWFGGADVGTLSIAEESENGTVLVRVEFGRPGIPDERRLFHASDLGRRVLLRFPGIEPVVAEPPEITAGTLEPPEFEPLDPARVDYGSALAAGVESGAVSEFEGTRRLLEFFLGEDDGAGLIPDEGVLDASPTTAVIAARLWAETAPEDEAATINALVDRLVPPDIELLDTSAPDTGGAAGDANRARPRLGQQPAQDADEGETVEPCPDGPAWEGLACLSAYQPGPETGLPDSKYQVQGPPIDELPLGGVTSQLYDDVFNGMVNTALIVEALEDVTRPVVVRFTQSASTAIVGDVGNQERCLVAVHTGASTLPREAVRQQVALEIARCWSHDALPGDFTTGSGPVAGWTNPAFPYAISAIAEPEGRLEEKFLASLPSAEFDQPLHLRGVHNAFFFLWLSEQFGSIAMTDLVASVPTDTSDSVIDALTSDFDDLFHEYTRAFTDGALPDGVGRPYSSASLAYVLVPEPYNEYGFEFATLRAGRVQVQVPSGMVACASFEAEGDVQVGWREVPDGSWGEPPDGEVRDSAWWVATFIEPGDDSRMVVRRIIDEGDDCDAEPESPGRRNPIELLICPLICDPSAFFSSSPPPSG